MSLYKTSLLAVSLFACQLTFADETIEKSFNVAPGGTLELRTDAGSIEIATHSSDEIDVEVEIEGESADEFEVTFKERNNGLEIRGEKEGKRYWNSLRVKFYITVPKEYNLELMTAGGRIAVDDLDGHIDANTSGGSINVGDVNGNVELHTSGGSIRTDSINGEIDAHTSGGSINVTFATQPKEDASLTTSGGSVTAVLPANASFDIDASTSGGRVRSEFNVDGRIKKQSIRGEVNGGGPEIKLHTSGGSVRIEKN